MNFIIVYENEGLGLLCDFLTEYELTKNYNGVNFIIRPISPSTVVQFNKESDEMIFNI